MGNDGGEGFWGLLLRVLFGRWDLSERCSIIRDNTPDSAVLEHSSCWEIRE